MMHQILHHPELSNLDLSSLAAVATGAARVPSELLGAFKRRAKNLPFYIEGSDLSCHQWIALIWILIGYGLSECVCFADCLSIRGAKQVLLRPLQLSCSPFQECMEAAWTPSAA
jgi:acyl-CoA synthetase (AMP-forming)/AMP-acid ligase II